MAPQAASAEPVAPTRWGIVAIAVAAGVVAATQVGKAPPSLPDIRAELAVGMVGAGWIVSILNATTATLGIAIGTIADRVGHNRALAFGLALLAIGSLLGGIAGSAGAMLLTRFLEGIGFVCIIVAAPSLIAEAASLRHQRLALGLWSAYFPAGMGAMMVASLFVLEPYGWRSLWFASAVLILVFLMVFLVVAARGRRGGRLPSGARAGRGRALADVRRALARPGPWLLAFTFTAFSLQWLGLLAWLPTFLVEQGYTRATAALVTAVVVVLEAPGNLIGGWLLHRGASRWTLISVAMLAMATMGAAILVPAVPPVAKVVLALAFTLISGLVPAAVLSGAPVHAAAPGLIGTVNGVIAQGSNLGSLMGPPAFAAVVVGFGGWQHASWLMLGAGLVGVLLALAIRLVEERL